MLIKFLTITTKEKFKFECKFQMGSDSFDRKMSWFWKLLEKISYKNYFNGFLNYHFIDLFLKGSQIIFGLLSFNKLLLKYYPFERNVAQNLCSSKLK